MSKKKVINVSPGEWNFWRRIIRSMYRARGTKLPWFANQRNQRVRRARPYLPNIRGFRYGVPGLIHKATNHLVLNWTDLQDMGSGDICRRAQEFVHA